MTTAEASPAHPPDLAQQVRDTTATITRIPAGAPVFEQLAHAFNGFYVARMVSVLLDAETSPRRDAYPLSAEWSTEALVVLFDVVGATLIRRHCPLHAGGEAALQEVTIAAQFELAAATDTDVARISDEMITLAAKLERLLTRIGQDEKALPEPRHTAQAVTESAHNIWSHYGGDGGGW